MKRSKEETHLQDTVANEKARSESSSKRHFSAEVSDPSASIGRSPAHPEPTDGQSGQLMDESAQARAARCRENEMQRPSQEDHQPSSSAPDMDLAKMKDQLLRLRADFDNFRKRTLREKTLLCETANEELLTELLPVLDHMQLALGASNVAGADPAFRQGLLMIFEQLMGILAKFGLEPIDAEGKPFDPELHEAVSCMPSDTHPEGTVIGQARRGYLLKKRLLRPAQVIVSGSPKLPQTMAWPKPGTSEGAG